MVTIYNDLRTSLPKRRQRRQTRNEKLCIKRKFMYKGAANKATLGSIKSKTENSNELM